MLILTSILCTHNINVNILIFICKISTIFTLALFCKVGYVYSLYEELVVITYSQPFVVLFIFIQLLLLPFFFILFFKSIGFKKVAVFFIYIYSLYLFIESCIIFNITNISSISVITISSLFTIIAVYKNFFCKGSKTHKLSMFKEFFTNFYFLPKEAKKLLVPAFIISWIITRLARYVLLDILDLSSLGLTSHLFIVFSLIVPSIIFFRIANAVILHIRLTHGDISIQYVIYKELFNISHYNLNNIDLNLILTIFTLGVFSITSVELIFFSLHGFNGSIQVNEGIPFDTKEYTWHNICSCNDVPLPADTSDSPTPSYFSFGSFSRTSSPALTFEQELWLNRRNSLADAKALDAAKRILLYKICLANNIPADLQMVIQDSVWGNHWYELYTTEYGHDQNGHIVRNHLLDWPHPGFTDPS